MEYLILFLTALIVGGFLLLLDVVVFGLMTIIDKCEELKTKLKKETSND